MLIPLMGPGEKLGPNCCSLVILGCGGGHRPSLGQLRGLTPTLLEHAGARKSLVTALSGQIYHLTCHMDLLNTPRSYTSLFISPTWKIHLKSIRFLSLLL